MKKTISILALALAFTACEDDDPIVNPTPTPTPTKTVEFSFKLKTANDFLSDGDTAQLSNGYDVYFNSFKLYISNIKAVNASGSTEVLDVALIDPIDLNDNSFTVEVPYGTYDQFEMGLGLDAQTNASDPASFADSHPLATFQSMYWSMLKYRFTKIEGKADLSGNLGGTDDISIAYHTGTDAMYRTVDLDDNSAAGDFIIDADNGLEVEVILDLDQYFNGAGGAVDIPNERSTHSTPAQIPLTTKLTDNLASSLIARFSVNNTN